MNITLVASILLFLELKSRNALIQISRETIMLPAMPIKKLSNFIANAKKRKTIKILSAVGSKISPKLDSTLYFLARNPSK